MTINFLQENSPGQGLSSQLEQEETAQMDINTMESHIAVKNDKDVDCVNT
jgi:hypothetical protein